MSSKESLKHDDLADSFIFSIVHDLKNMMVPIMSRADMLQMPGLSEEKRKYLLKQMNISCSTMMDALNKVVRICKDRNGMGTYLSERFSLRFLVLEVLDVLEEGFAQKSVLTVNEVPADVEVVADRESILGVVMNLVGNALKFSNEGGQVRLYTIDRGPRIEVCVEDDGIGIEEDRIKRLLEENQYFTTPGTSGEPGTGFGLMLCESQLLRNGSRLQYRRNELLGSTFSFEIDKSQN